MTDVFSTFVFESHFLVLPFVIMTARIESPLATFTGGTGESGFYDMSKKPDMLRGRDPVAAERFGWPGKMY